VPNDLKMDAKRINQSTNINWCFFICRINNCKGKFNEMDVKKLPILLIMASFN
jgi:hypothetical protein